MNKKVNKDIEPINSKGQFHGYFQWSNNGKLRTRYVVKNDKTLGYAENHSIKTCRFFIK